MAPLLAAAIISTTISNASGGNAHTSNAVNGSAYSSVSVETVVNDDGGTSTVRIESDDNGKVGEETYTKTIPPGGTAQLYVATSTGQGSAQVRTIVHAGTAPREVFSTSTAASSLSSSSGQLSLPPARFAIFGAWFRNMLRFFRISW